MIERLALVLWWVCGVFIVFSAVAGWGVYTLNRYTFWELDMSPLNHERFRRGLTRGLYKLISTAIVAALGAYIARGL